MKDYSAGKKKKSPAPLRPGQEPEAVDAPRKPLAFPCPYAGKCGGCQLLHLTYTEQLVRKQARVRELLKPFCPVRPILGMSSPLYYRNKVHAVFDRNRKNEPVCGVYAQGTHRVVPVEGCLLEDKKSGEIIQTVRTLARQFKILIFDENNGTGLLRHVLVRRGFTSGEIMVVLVAASPVFPSVNNFVKALLERHPEITTVVLNINGKNTSMVLGDRNKVLFGKGFIEDTLCGCVFRISPSSFYQVNPVQTKVLYEKAIELASLHGTETVLDAYCGIGTIGLIAARQAHRVISVELNPDAVHDAILNAKRNQISNIRFHQGDAGEFMQKMALDGHRPDVVFMDPPRSGSDLPFLSSVVRLAPPKVVYISCNPETLARDLRFLVKNGYRVAQAVPVDMFPMTEHIETVCLLSKLK